MISYLVPILDIIIDGILKKRWYREFSIIFSTYARISPQGTFYKSADRFKWNTSLTNSENGLDFDPICYDISSRDISVGATFLL